MDCIKTSWFNSMIYSIHHHTLLWLKYCIDIINQLWIICTISMLSIETFITIHMLHPELEYLHHVYDQLINIISNHNDYQHCLLLLIQMQCMIHYHLHIDHVIVFCLYLSRLYKHIICHYSNKMNETYHYPSWYRWIE